MAAQDSVVSNKLLVVFDLNGTLMWSRRDGTVIARPHFDSLLKCLAELHSKELIEIGTWTARTRSVSMNNVRSLFPVTVPRLFAFDRSDCSLHPTKRNEIIKDLNRVWELYPQYSIKNTIIVDDTPDKIYYSQMKALYAVPTFRACAAEPEPDVTLLHLCQYLTARCAQT